MYSIVRLEYHLEMKIPRYYHRVKDSDFRSIIIVSSKEPHYNIAEKHYIHRVVNHVPVSMSVKEKRDGHWSNQKSHKCKYNH